MQQGGGNVDKGEPGINAGILSLAEKQQQLLDHYQQLARMQSSTGATTSGRDRTGGTLSIQMRPREPPVFMGKKDQDVEVWLHQVDDYFALTQPQDDAGVAYMILLLHGFARDWWEAEFKSSGGRQPGTIAELKTLLRAAFSSPLRERKARAELRNLRQGSGEDYREYASRFKSLLSKLPPGSWTDAVAMDDWIFGLIPPYGERVMALKPKTLDEAIALMGELDIARQFCHRDGGKGGAASGSGESSKKGKKAHSGEPSTSDGFSKKKKDKKSGKKGFSTGDYPAPSGKAAGPSDGSSSLKCFYCGKKGHKKSECRKFQRDVQAKFAMLKAAGVPASGPEASGSSGRRTDADDAHRSGK